MIEEKDTNILPMEYTHTQNTRRSLVSWRGKLGDRGQRWERELSQYVQVYAFEIL